MNRSGRGRIPAVIITALAIAAAVGIRTFISPCIHEDGAFGSCHFAGQAVFGLSLLMTAEGVLAAVWNNAGVRRGIFLSVLLAGILGILIPGTLIGLCSMAAMRCRAVMRPAVTILFSLMCAAAAGGIISTGER